MRLSGIIVWIAAAAKTENRRKLNTLISNKLD